LLLSVFKALKYYIWYLFRKGAGIACIGRFRRFFAPGVHLVYRICPAARCDQAHAA
jgi:hypothetical protein